MRIIPANKSLLNCNIGHTALCDFCSVEIETLNHLFWGMYSCTAFLDKLISILTGIQYINPIQLKKSYAGYYRRNKYNRNPN